MKTVTNANNSTAAGPRWVLLNRHNDDDDSDSSADAKQTTAVSCTSSGLRFSVSFSAAAPPAASSIHGDWVGGDDGKHSSDGPPELVIIAAHDDAVLIEMTVPERDSYSDDTFEYFLYEAGAGRRPPSLSLLPGCYVSMQCQRAQGARHDVHVPTFTSRARYLSGGGPNDTGILRRGEGEVLVAQLEVGYDAPYRYSKAELCVLRPGGRDWVLWRVPIVHHEGEGVVVRDWTEIDAAVAVGTRFICWVDYLSGFLLCDMAAEEDENTKLRYVPLPTETRRHENNCDGRPLMQYCRNLAAAGAGAVRFVSVAPRCCCGGPGTTTCERSRSAFNVTTWTLALRTEEPMAWVKDGVLDCDELWQLPNYGRLPRLALKYPIVSSDDPDVVCFAVCDDDDVWIVQINTRSKALLSVVRSDSIYYTDGDLLPAKLRWK